MGILSGLFGGARNSDDEPRICDSCSKELGEDEEMDEGRCEDCNSDYSGATYCCGQIYEEGEDTCASCGEPL